MNQILRVATAKKSLIMLFVLMLLTFSLLLFRSIVRLNNYQSYLNDSTRLIELNQSKIDTDRLMVNPFDFTLIMNEFQSNDSNCGVLSTESSNSAFFYNIDTNSVELYQIEDLIDQTQESIQTIDGTDYRINRNPEGFFHESLIHLCEKGDILSDAIAMIRATAKPDASFEVYDNFMTTLEQDSIFSFLFERHDHEMYEAAQTVLERFHPDRTLYVNDFGWNTAANDLNVIEQIVFDADIETIPTFDRHDLKQTDQALIRLYDLNLPASVKRIETDAFPEYIFDILMLKINNLNDLILEDQSIVGVQDVILDIPLFDREDTIDFSDHIDIDVDPTGQVRYTFDAMTPFIQQYGLNEFTVREDNGIVLIDFYANDFLIGYARNVYITTYYLSPDEDHPYHIGISNEDRFMDIEIPTRPGYVFNGWTLGDGIITEGDGLPNKTVEVYADWIENS